MASVQSACSAVDSVRPNRGSSPAAGARQAGLSLTLDARIWRTGIGTYTRNLLSAIRRFDCGLQIKAIASNENAREISAHCDQALVVDTPIYGVREQFQIARAAGGCDLFHAPHYNIPLLYRGPLVTTIHDVTHLTGAAYRHTAKAWLYARPMLQLVGKMSSAVITVSEYSKKEIVERLKVAPEKIFVIHNGVSSHFHAIDRERAKARLWPMLGSGLPYVLFVGSLKPHKNVRTLVRAFARRRVRSSARHLLVLCGDDRLYRDALLAECAALGVQDSVRHIPWVPEGLLPSVYAAAELLVMPSFSEGFGLPVLEAMACGTPVVCSRAASLPEIGGDAAIYFDPQSVDDLVAAMERVLESTSLREELRAKGLARASRFTWEESARRHIEVYRLAAAGERRSWLF